MGITLTGTFIHQTNDAVLIQVDQLQGYELWIPKSVCLLEDVGHWDEVQKYDQISLEIEEWWADKEGL